MQVNACNIRHTKSFSDTRRLAARVPLFAFIVGRTLLQASASGQQGSVAGYELRYSVDDDLCRASQTILLPREANATKGASNDTGAKRIDWAFLKVGTRKDDINGGGGIPSIIETDIDNDGQIELVLKWFVWMRQKSTANITVFESPHPFYAERSIQNFNLPGRPGERDDITFLSFPHDIAPSKIARIPTREEIGTEPGVSLHYTTNVDVDVMTFGGKNYFVLRNDNAVLPPGQDPATVLSYDSGHTLRIDCVFIK